MEEGLIILLGFPCGSAGKESALNAGDLGLIPGLGRSPGEGTDYPLQYSGLENFMDYNPWGRRESDTTEQLSLSLSIFYWQPKVPEVTDTRCSENVTSMGLRDSGTPGQSEATAGPLGGLKQGA